MGSGEQPQFPYSCGKPLTHWAISAALHLFCKHYSSKDVCVRYCLMALVTLQLWWRSQSRRLYVEKQIRYEGIFESTVQCCLGYNTDLSIIQLRQFTCSMWEGSVHQSSFKFTLTLFKCGLHAAAHRPKHYRFLSPNVIHKSKLIAAKHKFSQIFNALH